MSIEPAVLVEVRDRKIHIGMNRPDVLNAQNDEMRGQLVDAVERMEADPDVLVGILYGMGGRAFSAGADLKEHIPNKKPSRLLPDGQRPVWRHFDAFRFASKPVIAAIDGYCIGGGLELANYCDIRVATEQSRFGQPEPRTVGVTSGPGLIQLSRLVPTGEALFLQLTSQQITAHRAYDIGLVQRLCPDREALMAEVDAIADQIMEGNPEALRRIKRVVKWGDGLPFEVAEKLAMLGVEAAEYVRENEPGQTPTR